MEIYTIKQSVILYQTFWGKLMDPKKLNLNYSLFPF